ncbi:type II toxin-antitoxin system VapC family toxin [Hydrogenivirga sp. 128-5-R1-1]|uniref:PIN domain-containing protein n=1 Tax=Hydrogenivirga sp. 128-5-R1-1 TaxID=392423 RepID=UPI000681A8A7
MKGNKTELLENLINDEYKLYINGIIYSEFMFHFISAVSGKSPFTLKKKKIVANVLNKYEPLEFLEVFEILPETNGIIDLSYFYMKKYNLLPNDSLILSTYKFYKLDFLATYDSDFKEVSRKEEVKLIT